MLDALYDAIFNFNKNMKKISPIESYQDALFILEQLKSTEWYHIIVEDDENFYLFSNTESTQNKKYSGILKKSVFLEYKSHNFESIDESKIPSKFIFFYNNINEIIENSKELRFHKLLKTRK